MHRLALIALVVLSASCISKPGVEPVVDDTPAIASIYLDGMVAGGYFPAHVGPNEEVFVEINLVDPYAYPEGGPQVRLSVDKGTLVGTSWRQPPDPEQVPYVEVTGQEVVVFAWHPIVWKLPNDYETGHLTAQFYNDVKTVPLEVHPRIHAD